MFKTLIPSSSVGKQTRESAASFLPDKLGHLNLLSARLQTLIPEIKGFVCR